MNQASEARNNHKVREVMNQASEARINQKVNGIMDRASEARSNHTVQKVMNQASFARNNHTVESGYVRFLCAQHRLEVPTRVRALQLHACRRPTGNSRDSSTESWLCTNTGSMRVCFFDTCAQRRYCAETFSYPSSR